MKDIYSYQRFQKVKFYKGNISQVNSRSIGSSLKTIILIFNKRFISITIIFKKMQILDLKEKVKHKQLNPDTTLKYLQLLLEL